VGYNFRSLSCEYLDSGFNPARHPRKTLKDRLKVVMERHSVKPNALNLLASASETFNKTYPTQLHRHVGVQAQA
jgi:hypothetical protein